MAPVPYALRVVCALLALAVVQRCAAAASLYVDPLKGNDLTGTGAASQPFQSIARGANASLAGDTLVLRRGVYEGAANTGVVLNRPLCVRGEEGAESTLVRGSGTPFTTSASFEVSGLTFEGCKSCIVVDARRTGENASLSVDACWFSDVPVGWYAIHVEYGDRLNISRSVFVNGAVLYTWYMKEVAVESTRLYNFTAQGMFMLHYARSVTVQRVLSDSTGNCFYMHAPGRVAFADCVFRNSFSPVHVQTAGMATMARCTFSGSTSYSVRCSDSVMEAHACTFANSTYGTPNSYFWTTDLMVDMGSSFTGSRLVFSGNAGAASVSAKQASNVSLSQCAAVDNNAGNFAVFVCEGESSLAIERSVIANNTRAAAAYALFDCDACAEIALSGVRESGNSGEEATNCPISRMPARGNN